MWYSKAFGGKVEAHKQKLWAISRCNFAAAGGEGMDVLGVYRRDPEKNPDEPNLLPEMVEKQRQKKMAAQIRSIMGRKQREAR